MPSRHQVRQAVIQCLYSLSLDQQENSTDEDARLNAVWAMILESDCATLDKARVKAVSHLTRDLPDKIRLFLERSKKTQEAIVSNSEYSELRDDLSDLSKREQSLDASVRSLRSAKKSDPASETQAMVAAYNSLQITNATLLQIRPKIITKLANYPQIRYVTDPLKSAINKLQEISARIDGLEHPEGHKNITEFASVIKTSKSMTELRQEASELLHKVTVNREEIDQIIADKLANSTPERLSPIDRAILRLATYELKYRREVATPVIIKEAIRLAEDYSTPDAPKFINGVLSGIVTVCRG